jgi:hypothetical protein
MVGLFVAPCLFAFWLLQELELRRAAGVEPHNFAELWRLSNKSRSPDRSKAALCFALVAALLFSYWEGALRALLSRGPHGIFVVVGALTLIAAIAFRRKAFSKSRPALTRLDLALLWVGWVLTLHAWLSLVLFSLWIGLRARVLAVKR